MFFTRYVVVPERVMMPLKTEFLTLFLRVFSFGDTILHCLCSGQAGAEDFFSGELSKKYFKLKFLCYTNCIFIHNRRQRYGAVPLKRGDEACNQVIS
jgi:hypothetical protein